MDLKMLNTKLLAFSFFLQVSLFVWGAVNGEVIRCRENERKALLRFKSEIIVEFNALSSWGSEEERWECCKWNGVLCSNRTGHVISLQLVGLLRGNLSSALQELHHLTSLDLSYNDFRENEIPEFIGSFKNIKHLYLRYCRFTGIVPHQLGNLTNLRTLDLGRNEGLKIDSLKWLSSLSSLLLLDLSFLDFAESLESIVLQDIAELPSLRELHLSNSRFPNVTSSFDDVFVNSTSTSLSILDLSNIGLTSSTFHWLFNISTSFVSIDLSGNQLDGFIPDVFGKQFFLEDLNLSGNRLEGGIPKSLWNLSSLQTLRASNNYLREALSNSFPNLPGDEEVSLQVLDLSANQITGSFPELRLFPALTQLHLDNNALKGTIFEANLSGLNSLKVLDLSFNSLTLNFTPDWIAPFQLDAIYLARCHMGPRFPAWLQTQSNFSRLDLSFSNISDELPKWFWDLSFRLDYLDLSHNQISGRLPNFSSNFANFSLLDLSFNNFSGFVPILHPKFSQFSLSNNMFVGSIPFLCTITYDWLRSLDLSNNQLSGQLPNCWESMKYLAILNLANNNFTGEIPNTLGSLQNLLRLHLRNNNFSGVFPSSLKNCQQLAMIDVGGNKLAGNFPAWIGTHLTGLIVLSFRGNRFQGSIPPELCHLTSIRILDLSRNNISGRIPPKCFNNLTSLVRKTSIETEYRFVFSSYNLRKIYNGIIDDALVQWKQQEFVYSKTLHLLTLVDLSGNRLVGNIPSEMFRLRGLISLNLSRNHLTGNINSDIDTMEMLESLDLSRNLLSGEIPVGLRNLTFLQVLDLSNNKLSGQIPSSTQLQSFNSSVYAGNIELCGPPLPRCPKDGRSTSSGNHGKHDNGDDFTTTQSILQEFYIPAVLGFIVGFWGTIATLILKNSWRYTYFNFFNKLTNWVYVKAAIYVTRLR